MFLPPSAGPSRRSAVVGWERGVPVLAQLWDEGREKSVGEGVEPIPGVRRRCGAMCVLSGMVRLALRQCFGANLAETKEQGKCRLSGKKALSISPTNCADPSSVVETQLTLQHLDPASAVRDKQIYSYIPWADLP